MNFRQKVLKIFFESSFRITPENQEKIYNVYKDEYEKSIGQSWSFDDFSRASSNWTFFGDESGFVSVRFQNSGMVKFTGAAGNSLSKLRGMKEIIALNKPTWGVMTKELAEMSKKIGFLVPPGLLVKMIAPFIPKEVMGSGHITSVQWDGGLVIDDPRIGKTMVKYLIGNKQYFQELLKNKDTLKLPDIVVNAIMKFLG